MLVACQDNAYTRRMLVEVLSCEPSPTGGFEVILSDTLLYPEGGGQPPDYGRIGEVKVRDVQRFGDGEASKVIHTVECQLELGPATVEVDWMRRYDHMQQHSAQHLLSAIAQDHLPEALSTVAFHLGETTCTIDLDGILDGDGLTRLAKLANDNIRLGLPVRHRLVDKATWSNLRAKIRTRGLPPGHFGEVRLVEIEGLDLNTCGGTHVASTAELQAIFIVRAKKVRGGTRFHYLAGGRALEFTHALLSREAHLTERLCVAPDQHLERVDKLLEGRKTALRRQHDLEASLAECLGRQLSACDGHVATLHQNDVGLPFLNSVARATEEARKQAGAPGMTLLLTSSGAAGSGVFMVTGAPEIAMSGGPIVAKVLGGRGGGGRGRYQGTAGDISVFARERAFDALKQVSSELREEDA